MGRPGYFTDQSSFDSGLVTLNLEWTSGATGAVPALNTANFPHSGVGEVVSVVRAGVGVFTITLAQPWFDLIRFVGWTIQATYSAAGACNVRVTANNTGASPPTLVLLVTTAAGAAVDPTTNDVVYVNLQLQSHQAGY